MSDDHSLRGFGDGLSRAAKRFQTPLYVYSAAILRERFITLDRAFASVPHTICYSVKANSNLSVLRLLHEMGAGFDVVSGGELERVLVAIQRKRTYRSAQPSRAASPIVFSGVGKTAEEMDAALAAGIRMFNVESEGELHLLAERAAQAKKRAPVALRINLDIPARTHPYISTGLRQHKFGIPISQAARLYRWATREKWLGVCGVSLHIGSQITTFAPFRAAVSRAAELVRALGEAGIRIRYLDAGGGLGIPYRHARGAEKDFRAVSAAYAKAIIRPLHGLNLHLLLEPGRCISGPAGVLLTRVLYIKRNGGRNFAVCDAAMNDLLRPALYGAYHEIVAVKRLQGRRRMVYDVVGPVCETGDFLGQARKLPELDPGDLLAVLDAGAYGMSLASNYNSRPRPAEVLMNGAKMRLVRGRESTQELMAGEK